MKLLHPRRAEYEQYWNRRQYHLRNRGPGVLASTARVGRPPPWVDYYPWVPGTICEKMVFGELVAKGVSFFFAPYWGDMPFTPDAYEHYRPDFVLPEYRIVIEVFGYYWHSLEGSVESDARKAAMYEASGYKHYVLWDYEIYEDVAGAIDRKIPELRNPYVRTGNVVIADRPHDPRASMTAQRRSAPKVVRLRVKPVGPKSPVQLPLVSRDIRLTPPLGKKPDPYPAYSGLDPEYLKELRQYSWQWKEYVQELGDYFREYGSGRSRYPDLWSYWNVWKGWWYRWQNALRAVT